MTEQDGIRKHFAKQYAEFLRQYLRGRYKKMNSEDLNALWAIEGFLEGIEKND